MKNTQKLYSQVNTNTNIICVGYYALNSGATLCDPYTNFTPNQNRHKRLKY